MRSYNSIERMMGGIKMNKKQAFIIATLLVLIVCAGILATKVNSPLYVNGNDLGGQKSTFSLNNNKTSSSATDFFVEQKSNREHANATTTANLKALIDDQNASKEQRDAASKKYMTVTMAFQNEQKIEASLKAKSFEEAVCTINDDKVSVIVKSKEKLTDKQVKQIQDVVMSITKIKDVEIDYRQ